MIIIRRLSLDLKPLLSKKETDSETVDPIPKTGEEAVLDLSSHGTDTFHTAASLTSEPNGSPAEVEKKATEDNRTSSSQNSECAVKSIVGLGVMSDSGVGLEITQKGTGSGESSGGQSVKANEPVSAVKLEFKESVAVNNRVNNETSEEERIDDKDLFSCEDDSDELSSSPGEGKRNCAKSHSSSRGITNSPSSTEASSFEKVSPIRSGLEPVDLEEQNMTVNEAMLAMKKLYQDVAHQKMLILQSLESDCDKEELNRQIVVSIGWYCCIAFVLDLNVITAETR